MGCMKPHIARFFRAAREQGRDFWEGHAWVNLYAEGLRCLGVAERIVKARIAGRVGLPHILAGWPLYLLAWWWF